MGSFFSLDGPLISFLDKCGRVVLLTVLWIIFSLPVFTFGASTAAFYYGIVKTVRHERSSMGKSFWNCFKQNLKKTIPYTLLMILVFVILIIDIVVWKGKATKTSVFNMNLCIVILVMFVSVAVYVFPAISRFKLSFKEMVKFCFFIAFKHLPYTIGIVICDCLMILTIVCVPVSALFVPGACCMVVSYLIENIFKKYIPEPSAGEEKWYDE